MLSSEAQYAAQGAGTMQSSKYLGGFERTGTNLKAHLHVQAASDRFLAPAAASSPPREVLGNDSRRSYSLGSASTLAQHSKYLLVVSVVEALAAEPVTLTELS